MAATPRGTPTSPLLLALRHWVDPVVALAGFEWNDSGLNTDADGCVRSVLYEADPIDFVHSYPDTGLQESYPDDEWPPACVDLWLEFDRERGRTDLDLEGFEIVETLRASGRGAIASRASRLTDDPDEDARMIAAALAMVLGVPGPDTPNGGTTPG